MTTTDTLRSQGKTETQTLVAAEGPTPDVPVVDQNTFDAQLERVVGRDDPDTAPTGQGGGDTQMITAGGGGPNIRNGHHSRDAQSMAAVADQAPDQPTGLSVSNPATAGRDPSSGDHSICDTPACPVAAPTQRAPAQRKPSPTEPALALADPFLALAADVLDDLETVRIANENRLRQLTRDTTDSDGLERGFGLTLDHPDVARLAALVDGLGKAEHQAELNLAKLLRQHPLGPWMKAQKGVGPKQGARLLAAVGDPYWNDLHGRPRTVSELWAYCGLHVVPAGHLTCDTHEVAASGASTPASQACSEPQSGTAGGEGGDPDRGNLDTQPPAVGVAANRTRGQRANWSADAKMRAWLVAVSCMKSTGPYRDVYDQGRAKYADSVHKVECKRCGPAGKPALIGSPLSAGHQHARALRLVAKTVLKELWREAKRLHENVPPGQGSGASHDYTAGRDT